MIPSHRHKLHESSTRSISKTPPPESQDPSDIPKNQNKQKASLKNPSLVLAAHAHCCCSFSLSLLRNSSAAMSGAASGGRQFLELPVNTLRAVFRAAAGKPETSHSTQPLQLATAVRRRSNARTHIHTHTVEPAAPCARCYSFE